MYLRNYGLPKTSLYHCLKSPIPDHLSKSNMLNAPKHCSNLKDTPFTILLDHWEVNCFPKSLC